MSASLVGSEMCIRDRPQATSPAAYPKIRPERRQPSVGWIPRAWSFACQEARSQTPRRRRLRRRRRKS
eukprot:788349-Alexandrium_andersonii.AAC.1